MLDGFFQPESIAIIGASRTPGSLGKLFFDNVVQFGYTGKIYPVNPKADEIDGIRCYPDIESLPEGIDMAVILVRKDLALSAVESCGKKRIKQVIVVTAGFKEVGGEGIEREHQLVEAAKKYDMRLIGPNCMGLFNTDPKVKLNASFSPTQPLPGHVAFISQSGALGVAVLELAKRMNLGFSIFVSMGNKADLKDADFIQYLETDDNTSVITLYQESVDDPLNFMRMAKRITRRKPMLVLKAGRTDAGQKAASSHTGALASSDKATQALFDQSGIIRVDNIRELFEASLAFSTQPIPAGNRICVLTNAGGPAILATDAIDREGLQMAELGDQTKQKLKSFLPEEASVHNPVDMIASATHETYRESAKIILEDDGVDALMVIIVRPPTATTPKQIIEEIHSVVPSENKKPVLFIVMAEHDEESGVEKAAALGYPVYDFPESAAFALAKMMEYKRILEREEIDITTYPVDREKVTEIISIAQQQKREHLLDSEVREILSAYGIPQPEFIIAKSVTEALDFYRKLNGPVVLKIESPKVIHKSDMGGVKVNLNSESDIEQGFSSILKNIKQHVSEEDIEGILVQQMIKGREVALGMAKDPQYGPMLMFGLGGIFVEIFKDVNFRLAPINRYDAEQMVTRIKGYPILAGARGEQPVHFETLYEVLQRLSQLVINHPEIEEMDINPLIMNSDSSRCKAVDARIRIKL
ncbi:MAG: acetate--CoA ligase [Calditrichia bacterium]